MSGNPWGLQLRHVLQVLLIGQDFDALRPDNLLGIVISHCCNRLPQFAIRPFSCRDRSASTSCDQGLQGLANVCLLYTSDAADDGE